MILVQKKESGSCLEFWVKFWAPQNRDMATPEHVQQRAITMMKYMEHLAYAEKLTGLELFILKEGRLKGILYQSA